MSLDQQKKKPKIALIVDTHDWAFANIANNLKKNISTDFELIVVPSVYFETFAQLLLATKDCDILHFFWRDSVSYIEHSGEVEFLDSLGITPSSFWDQYLFSKLITTSIYDHLFLEPDEIKHRETIFADVFHSYTVCSQKLFEIYSAIPGYPQPAMIITDGVDLDLFRPKINRKNAISEGLVVGWVGNSDWNSHLQDPKGFHTILKPAITQLQNNGHNIVLNAADRQTGMIPREEMPNYYSSIDVLVCVSSIEGTPNPVLEAMACGVPVISTDVGIVPEVFGELQLNFVLKERSPQALSEAISVLLDNPGVLEELSKENLFQIRNWSWAKKTSLPYAEFFKNVSKSLQS